MNSLVSYPNRGPWGNPRYRGNCSGHLIRDLIRHYQPRSIADPAEGSGTTRDVSRDLGVAYHGFDLKDGFDLEATSLRDAVSSPVDLAFFHPPYYRIVRYSGSVWGKSPDARDLSHEDDWIRYVARLKRMVDHAREGAAPGGHLAVLVGDVRQRGAYYSAQAEFFRWFAPEEIDAVIVKAQHHVTSDRRDYGARPLVRIMHETCIVIRGFGGRHG